MLSALPCQDKLHPLWIIVDISVQDYTIHLPSDLHELTALYQDKAGYLVVVTVVYSQDYHL